jgi:hypothetical protein
MKPDKSKINLQKRVPQRKRNSVDVDVESLLSLENRCDGCASGEKCCCSSFEVCSTTQEMKRIIKVLPEAAMYCPHLLKTDGYDNVFEKEEPGLYSIDTTDAGLCLFAYRAHQRIYCSLHTVAFKLGLPLAQVKPKPCMLWPLQFSDGDEVLEISDDAFLFKCNIRKTPGSRKLNPGFVEVIEQVYGEGCGGQVKQAAEKGQRRIRLPI